MYEEHGLIRWARKVPQERIRRLYAFEAAGSPDEDLLADVAAALYERSRDVVLSTRASAGHATCPRCDAIIEHDGRPRTLLVCPCGFRCRWRAYAKTMFDRHLWGGRATPAFESYVRQYEQAETSRQRFLLVDRLLHALHTTCSPDGPVGGRTAAFNVIEGSEQSIIEFLDTLASAPAPAEILEHRARWSEVMRRPRK